jgi:hypothetical protein
MMVKTWRNVGVRGVKIFLDFTKAVRKEMSKCRILFILFKKIRFIEFSMWSILKGTSLNITGF